MIDNTEFMKILGLSFEILISKEVDAKIKLISSNYFPNLKKLKKN